jgi:hypothetical protein
MTACRAHSRAERAWWYGALLFGACVLPAAVGGAQNVSPVNSPVPEADIARARDVRSSASLVAGVGASHLRRFDRSTTVRFEYRHAPVLPWRVQPFVGVDAGEDRSVYVFAGVLRSVALGSRLQFTPSVGAGHFTEGEFVLGYPLEFRSGLELSARLADALSIGVAVHHVSNGGLGRLNPGSEQIVVFSSVALR